MQNKTVRYLFSMTILSGMQTFNEPLDGCLGKQVCMCAVRGRVYWWSPSGGLFGSTAKFYNSCSICSSQSTVNKLTSRYTDESGHYVCSRCSLQLCFLEAKLWKQSKFQPIGKEAIHCSIFIVMEYSMPVKRKKWSRSACNDINKTPRHIKWRVQCTE